MVRSAVHDRSSQAPSGHGARWFAPQAPRTGLVGAAGAVLVALAMLLLGAVPAAAHVEVSVDPAQAGARDATVTFTAAAESDTAGISMLQVQLPAGINPGDVTWVSGPEGWALTPTNDGYSVSGPPLPVGAEARYAITVKQLPDAPTVAFKTVQTYTDSTTHRWIEEPTPGGPEPENPAPMATLAPAAATTPAPSTPPSTRPSTPPPAPSAQSDEATPASDGGTPTGLWWGLAAIVAVAAGLVVLLIRRRTAKS